MKKVEKEEKESASIGNELELITKQEIRLREYKDDSRGKKSTEGETRMQPGGEREDVVQYVKNFRRGDKQKRY